MANNPPNTNDLNQRISQLRRQLENVPDSRKRFPLLNELSSHLIRVDPATGWMYVREQLHIARSLKDDSWIVKSLIQAGDYARIRTQYSQALRYLNKAWSLLKDSPDHFSEKSHIYRIQGVISSEHKGDFDEGVRIFMQALEFARRSENREDIGYALFFLAEAFYNLGRFDNALDTINEYLEGIREEILSDLGGRLFWLLGLIHTRLEDWEQALNRMNRSLDIYKEIGDVHGQAVSYRGLGLIHFDMGNYSEALTALHSSATLFQSMGQRLMNSLVLAEISRLYVAQGELHHAREACAEAVALLSEKESLVAWGVIALAKAEVLMASGTWSEAIPILEQALQNLHDGGLFYELSLAHRSLARANEVMGNTSDALTHYKRFIELGQQLMNNQVQRKLLGFEFREAGTKKNEGEVNQRSIELGAKEDRELAIVSMRLAATNELLAKLKSRILKLAKEEKIVPGAIRDIVQEIDSNKDSAKMWEAFEQQLAQLDHDFLYRLTTQYPNLTPAELRICSLLRMDLTNHEIADLLNLSGRTVDTHRTSIRKKMGLMNGENLSAALAKI